MGYRVEYPSGTKVPVGKKKSSKTLPLTVLFFPLFLLLAGKFWHQGATILRDALLPGDAAVTAAALQDLTAALKTGEPFVSALADFCRQVIQGAGIYLG